MDILNVLNHRIYTSQIPSSIAHRESWNRCIPQSPWRPRTSYQMPAFSEGFRTPGGCKEKGSRCFSSNLLSLASSTHHHFCTGGSYSRELLNLRVQNNNVVAFPDYIMTKSLHVMLLQRGVTLVQPASHGLPSITNMQTMPVSVKMYTIDCIPSRLEGVETGSTVTVIPLFDS